MASALVTGGNGFVGLALCQELMDNGWNVTSVARRPSERLEAMGVQQVSLDLASDTSQAPLTAAAAHKHAIFHLAALTRGTPEELEAANVQGTLRVLRACRQPGYSVTLVNVSSSAVVYGDSRTHKGTDERLQQPTKFASEYGRTKAKAESLVAKAHDVMSISLRFTQVLGIENGRFFSMLQGMAAKPEEPFYGDGTNLYSWLDISDAVQACLWGYQIVSGCMEQKKFFIASGNVTYDALMNGTLEALGLPRKPFISQQQGLEIAAAEAARVAREGGKPKLTAAQVLKMSLPQYHNTEAATSRRFTPQGQFPQFLSAVAANRERILRTPK